MLSVHMMNWISWYKNVQERFLGTLTNLVISWKLEGQLDGFFCTGDEQVHVRLCDK